MPLIGVLVWGLPFVLILWLDHARRRETAKVYALQEELQVTRDLATYYEQEAKQLRAALGEHPHRRGPTEDRHAS